MPDQSDQRAGFTKWWNWEENIVTFDATGAISEVEGVHQVIVPSGYYKITTDNSIILLATPNHSILIQRDNIVNWIQVSDILLSDKFYTQNKEWVGINNVEVILGETTVFDIDVEDEDVFYVEGILVHNKC